MVKERVGRDITLIDGEEMVKTELLVGCVHYNKYLRPHYNLVKNDLGEDLESVMLEINNRNQAILGKGGFFDNLELKFGGNDTRVIYGDIKDFRIQRGVKKVLEKDTHDNTDSEIAYLTLWLSHRVFKVVFDQLIFHERDKGFLEVMEKEEPQVVMVGRAHADYLKKQFPSVPYVAFEAPDIQGKVHRMLLGKPHKADEIINLGNLSDNLK